MKVNPRKSILQMHVLTELYGFRYGDIHAVTPKEKWYSVITMLVGIGFFFGPILGYMASTLTNSESKRARYTHRMGVINEHLVKKNLFFKYF